MATEGALTVVVDCSMYLAYLMPDEEAAPAERLFRELEAGACRAVVPYLFFQEVLHAQLNAYRRRKRIDMAALNAQILDLCRFRERVTTIPFPETAAHIHLNTQLALTHNLSAYDASYLALALALGAPLATLDDALAQAARAEGARFG